MHFFIVVPFIISVLTLVPSIVLDPSSFSQYLDYVFSILDIIFYIIPMGTFFSIFGIIMALQVFRIVIAFLRTLWGILPIV